MSVIWFRRTFELNGGCFRRLIPATEGCYSHVRMILNLDHAFQVREMLNNKRHAAVVLFLSQILRFILIVWSKSNERIYSCLRKEFVK
jgi:hypothetical protein